MSGRSQDDECKDRIYRAFNLILNGNKDETARIIIIRELELLASHADFQADTQLVHSISLVKQEVMGLDFNSNILPVRIEEIKERVYKLETY